MKTHNIMRYAYVDKSQPEDMYSFGRDIFSSGDLMNAVYSVFTAMLPNRFNSICEVLGVGIGDIASMYDHGIYVPCVRRTVFTDQVDIRNDGLIPQCTVVDFYGDKPVINCIKKISRFPHGVVPVMFGATYRSVAFWPETDRREGDELAFIDSYFTISSNDRVVWAKDLRINHPTGYAVFVRAAAGALNVYADKRFIWNVTTQERLLSRGETKLTLGVSEEHVKSLFYARSFPVTDAGRKRPILHWVRAHERRIKAGTDIDIAKHLRGIERFEMEGFPFEIINPTKAQARLAAE